MPHLRNVTIEIYSYQINNGILSDAIWIKKKGKKNHPLAHRIVWQF